MRISPLDFSQARTAPDGVVRGLEMLDPTACIVHVGGPAWIVGKVRQSSEARAQAEAMMDNWTRAVRSGKRLSPQGQHRVRFAQLALLGFRPVQQYRLIGAPDGRVVKDFERSRFLWLAGSNNELFQQIDDTAAERRDAAIADIGSVDRAKDAHKYAFSRSFMPSANRGPIDRMKSGWVKQPIPATL